MTTFLEGYEDVNARITRIRREFPTLRLVAYIEDINIEKGYILVRAEAYKNYDDQVPSAVDYAFEARSDRGVNLHFWVENCLTSAYGRVAGLLSPGTARPTRQDMEKVERLSAADIAVRPEQIDAWNIKYLPEVEGMPTLGQAMESVQAAMGGEVFEHAPLCVHGHMLLREGMSDKTGKAWKGHFCSEKLKAKQCPPVWYVLTGAGKWAK